jgi:predicted small lipoprotein YifL
MPRCPPRRVLLWTLILALPLLAGCGKKGALYLPDPPAQGQSAAKP